LYRNSTKRGQKRKVEEDETSITRTKKGMKKAKIPKVEAETIDQGKGERYQKGGAQRKVIKPWPVTRGA
jgi:hypothetical protein